MPKRAPTPRAELSLRALNRATLARQMLLAREACASGIEGAVARLAGLQAQWPKLPFLGLWSRLPDFTREDLARLLVERRLVRATTMRGTLHVLTAKDFLAVRAPLQPMLTRGMESVLKGRAGTFPMDRVLAEARAFLDHEPRTFTELRAHLQAMFPAADERAMGFAVRTHLPLVQVPTADAEWGFPADAAFAVAETWLGAALDETTELRPLVTRYLAALGPASVADVQAWSGLRALRPVLEAMRPELDVLTGPGGRELFDLPGAPRPAEDAPAPARLLPDLDGMIVAREGPRFVADAHRKHVFLPALRVRATFLVDGFVAGTWSVDHARRRATLTLEPFAALTRSVKREISEEAERMIRFHEPRAEDHDVRVAAPLAG